jgi:hypothetical protein
MKIRIPFIKKNLYIENRLCYDNAIVSLGCDCHPAYVLDTLHIRKQSLPFDWLKTEPTEGLNFAAANFRNDFKNFLSDLAINEKGNVVSQHFPFSEFFHDKDLLVDNNAHEKYKRKILRLLDLKQCARIDYLYTISISDLSQVTVANNFLESIKMFLKEIKDDDTLHIYFRCETLDREDQKIFDYFFEETKLLRNTLICLYLRETATYGIWGNEKNYKGLLSDLKINIRKKVFHEIYISDY